MPSKLIVPVNNIPCLVKVRKGIFFACFRIHSYSVALLLISAVILGYKYYSDGRIGCITDQDPIRAAVIETRCLTRSLYILDVPPGVNTLDTLDSRLPIGLESETKRYVTYYSKVSYYLLIQALLFAVPAWCWMFLEDGRWARIKAAENHIKTINCQLGRLRSYALLYYGCELLCLLNVVVQFWFTNWYLGGDYLLYGVNVIRYTMNATALPDNPNDVLFPFLARCDYKQIRSFQEKEKTVLCGLRMNEITRILYPIIWLWFVVLLVMFIVLMAYRLFIVVAWRWRGRLLHKYLGSSEHELFGIICSRNIGNYFLLDRILPLFDNQADINAFVQALKMCNREQVPVNNA